MPASRRCDARSGGRTGCLANRRAMSSASIPCRSTMGARAGDLPADVEWRIVTRNDIPPFIRSHLDSALAEGVGWKFAPLQLTADRPELALDNDCILWELPGALRRWQRGDRTPVMAEDVRV